MGLYRGAGQLGHAHEERPPADRRPHLRPHPHPQGPRLRAGLGLRLRHQTAAPCAAPPGPRVRHRPGGHGGPARQRGGRHVLLLPHGRLPAAVAAQPGVRPRHLLRGVLSPLHERHAASPQASQVAGQALAVRRAQRAAAGGQARGLHRVGRAFAVSLHGVLRGVHPPGPAAPVGARGNAGHQRVGVPPAQSGRVLLGPGAWGQEDADLRPVVRLGPPETGERSLNTRRLTPRHCRAGSTKRPCGCVAACRARRFRGTWMAETTHSKQPIRAPPPPFCGSTPNP
mmetsp:Transcript_109169/g.185249  ORF Transcript_109169/g.185249 Transcript_109169/m.185249 type:complete len:284 (+) Transcript_109169:336-1187(+)